MKHIFLLLCAICLHMAVQGQKYDKLTVGKLDIRVIPVKYAEVSYEKFKGVRYLTFQYHQECTSHQQFQLYDCFAIKDAGGNLIRYQGTVHMLNLLARHGWVLKETIEIVSGAGGIVTTETQFIFENQN